MFEEWLTSDDFPGTRVLARPFNGPEMLNLQVRGIEGENVYAVLRSAIKKWEHLPLIGVDKFAEEYEPAAIMQMRPDVALWLVGEISRRMSSVSEDERKN